jgi:hypothetical protein
MRSSNPSIGLRTSMTWRGCTTQSNSAAPLNAGRQVPTATAIDKHERKQNMEYLAFRPRVSQKKPAANASAEF